MTTVIADTANAVFIRHNNLARLNITDELRAEAIKRAGFRSKNIAILHFADAKGAKTLRIAHSDHFAGGHQHKRIGPFNLIHRPVNCLLDAACLQACARDQQSDQFSVAIRLENCALLLQRFAQGMRVDKAAVVSNGDRALGIAHHKGLRIFAL